MRPARAAGWTVSPAGRPRIEFVVGVAIGALIGWLAWKHRDVPPPDPTRDPDEGWRLASRSLWVVEREPRDGVTVRDGRCYDWQALPELARRTRSSR